LGYWPGLSCFGSAAEATTGDVVLVCTLGLSILSATRDLPWRWSMEPSMWPG